MHKEKTFFSNIYFLKERESFNNIHSQITADVILQSR